MLRWTPQCLALASLLDRVGGAAGFRDRSFWRRGVMYIGMHNPGARRPFPALAHGPSPSMLRGPLVLASVHAGQVELVGSLLESLPGEVLVFASRDLPTDRRSRSLLVGDEWQRAAATRRAIQALRSGGYVFVNVDGGGNARVETTLCGQRVSWLRGAFDLARIAGVPLLPLLARWDGRKAAISAGEPIAPDEPSTMAAALARWLESQPRGDTAARDHPSGWRAGRSS